MTAEDVHTWVMILGMAAIAFGSRAAFLLPAGRLRLPPSLEAVLRYAPAAALMAIIVPDLARTDGALALSLGNARLMGGLVAFAIAIGTRSIILPIVGGMLVLTLVRLLG